MPDMRETKVFISPRSTEPEQPVARGVVKTSPMGAMVRTLVSTTPVPTARELASYPLPPDDDGGDDDSVGSDRGEGVAPLGGGGSAMRRAREEDNDDQQLQPQLCHRPPGVPLQRSSSWSLAQGLVAGNLALAVILLLAAISLSPLLVPLPPSSSSSSSPSGIKINLASHFPLCQHLLAPLPQSLDSYLRPACLGVESAGVGFLTSAARASETLGSEATGAASRASALTGAAMHQLSNTATAAWGALVSSISPSSSTSTLLSKQPVPATWLTLAGSLVASEVYDEAAWAFIASQVGGRRAG